MISSSRATACGFSILAITSARPLAIALTSATSSGRCTKESAIQSMFSSSAALRSARSLSVIAEVGMVVSGRLTPFLLETRPATSTTVAARPGSASATRSITLPSSMRMRWPGASELRISGCGNCTRAASPGAGSLSSTKASPLCRSAPPSANRPSLSFGPCRSTSIADRPAGLLLERADHRHPLAHRVMRGVAHVDAEDVGAGGEQSRDGLAVGRGRAEGGDDLDAAAATGMQGLLHEVGRLKRRGDGATLRLVLVTGVTGSRNSPGR